MAEFKLTQAASLDRLNERMGTTSLREIDAAHVVTLSIPLGREDTTHAAVEDLFGCPLPAVGTSTPSAETGAHILRLGADRLMVLHLPHRGLRPDMERALQTTSVYRVDQSDFWALLDLTGPDAVSALERSCRLDMDAEIFPADDIARTPIDGVSTILVRLEIDRFLMIVSRSYALSLAHTLLTSMRFVSMRHVLAVNRVL